MSYIQEDIATGQRLGHVASLLSFGHGEKPHIWMATIKPRLMEGNMDTEQLRQGEHHDNNDPAFLTPLEPAGLVSALFS